MIILFFRFILALLANALGLFVASLILDGFSINGVSFVTAVLIFSIVTAVLSPLIVKIAFTSATFLMGGTALVTTFFGLLITSLITDGIVIDGFSTWFLATLVVWGFSLIGSVVLPMFLFKKHLAKKNSTPPPPPTQG